MLGSESNKREIMKKRILLTFIAILGAVVLLAPLKIHADGKEGGTLTCTTSNNQVWNINGTYSKFDMAPEVDVYRGSTFVQHFSSTDGYVQISLQVAAQTTNQTYSLYDGTSTAAPLLVQTTCTAKTVSPAPVKKTTTTTTTTTPGGTATTPAAATPVVSDAAPDAATTPVLSDDTVGMNANDQKQSNKLTGPLLAVLILSALLAFLLIVSTWTVFRKAGRPGWGL
jgi:hypothetical protein